MRKSRNTFSEGLLEYLGSAVTASIPGYCCWSHGNSDVRYGAALFDGIGNVIFSESEPFFATPGKAKARARAIKAAGFSRCAA